MKKLIVELGKLGCRLSLDQKRNSGKWKAEAWKYSENGSVWQKYGDALGDTPKGAIVNLIHKIDIGTLV